jgi:hypothetical protein
LTLAGATRQTDSRIAAGEGAGVQVIHFTEGATDPLEEIASHDARFVQLLAGSGENQLGCLHLGAGGNLARRSISRDCALLTVHGGITFIEDGTGLRLPVSGGMGVLLNANEYFALESDQGGIMLLVQCQHLRALESGISTPQRIMGQRWPGEDLPRGAAEL